MKAMEEGESRQLRQLRVAIREEIGQAYELVVLPRLRGVDEKLDILLASRDDHHVRLNRLERWRDGMNESGHRLPHWSWKAMAAMLLLLAALMLSIAAVLLLAWLTRISGDG